MSAICGNTPRGVSELSWAEEKLALDMRALGLPEPQREFRFCPPRRFRFDFAWPDRMLAVEVDGGTHSRGRHVRADGFERDAEKLNIAVWMGWKVLRFTSAMVKDGRAAKTMEEVFADE